VSKPIALGLLSLDGYWDAMFVETADDVRRTPAVIEGVKASWMWQVMVEVLATACFRAMEPITILNR
jgi:hypothetical protein